MNELLSQLGNFGLGAVIGGGVIYYFIKNYLPSYISEKAKNLAKTEDIQKLTGLVEEVKLEYQTIIEDRKAKHQLRLAAIDKRLEVHQNAFMLWRKINSTLDTDSINDVILECNEFWGTQSLYLEAKPRKAFLEAWIAAKNIESYKKQGIEQKYITKLYERIDYLGQAISEAVELPKLNETSDVNNQINDQGERNGK